MSTSERVQLWAMRGLTAAEITHQTKLPRSTVKYHLKRFKETGSWSRREYPVRVKTLTPFAECIRKHLKLHPHASATELHELLANKFQLLVSVRTVQRYLKSAGRDNSRGGQAQDNSGEESDTSTTEELSVASGGEQASVSKTKTVERLTTISYSTPLPSEEERRAVDRRRRNAEVVSASGGQSLLAHSASSSSSSASSSSSTTLEPSPHSPHASSAMAGIAGPGALHSASPHSSFLPDALATSNHPQLLILSPNDHRFFAAHQYQLHRQQQSMHSSASASSSSSAFSSSASASHSSLRATHVSMSPLAQSAPSHTTSGGLHVTSPSNLLSSSGSSTSSAMVLSNPQQQQQQHQSMSGPSSVGTVGGMANNHHALLPLPFGLLPHYPPHLLLPSAHLSPWQDFSSSSASSSSPSSALHSHHQHLTYAQGHGTSASSPPSSSSASQPAAATPASVVAGQQQQTAAPVSALPLMNTSIPLGLFPVYPAFNTHNAPDARPQTLSVRPQLSSPAIALGAAATATLISPKVEPSLEALIHAALVSD